MRVLASFLGAALLALAPVTRAESVALEAGAGASEQEADSTQMAPEGADGDARPESGFQHALRLGVSLPAGISSDGRALGDDVVRRIPVMVDIGYRVNHALYLGLMAMVGLDEASDECGLAGDAPRASCTLEGWRVGVEAFVHPLPRDALDLWLGGGIGWEHLEEKVFFAPTADSPSAFGTTLRTWQEGPALDLAAGLDFPIDGKLAAGPFVGYTGGVFMRRVPQCPLAASCPGDRIDELGLHHWLTLGVRGIFGP
jgi:hypothetical protein